MSTANPSFARAAEVTFHSAWNWEWGPPGEPTHSVSIRPEQRQQSRQGHSEGELLAGYTIETRPSLTVRKHHQRSLGGRATSPGPDQQAAENQTS